MLPAVLSPACTASPRHVHQGKEVDFLKEIEEDGKEMVAKPWGNSKAHDVAGLAVVESFPACLFVAAEKPVSVTMDPIDHVRIVGEPFEVTCRVISPSHKYDIKWVTAAKNVS